MNLNSSNTSRRSYLPYPARHSASRFPLVWLAALIFGMVMLTLAPAKAVHAATFVVTKTADTNDGTCDADCSLREAIGAANAAAGADMITFDSSLDGTPITLSIPGTGENANATGDLDITDELTIVGNGRTNTIVQAGTNSTNGIDRVFHILPGANVIMERMTIRYGRINGSVGGGGVNEAGTLTITDAELTDNSADSGGAVYNLNGTVMLEQSTLANNTAVNDGGAVYNSAGTLTVTDAELTDNSANFGGAIFNYNGTVTLEQSTVANNTAANNSGGVDNSAFGAVTTLNVYNSTFSGNSAGFTGGAILAYSGGSSGSIVNLVNATIHDNNGAFGGLAAWNGTASINAVINMENSIIADQTGATADCVSISSGQFNSNDHNLDSDGTCNLVQTNDIPNGTANLGPLQDNGGHTRTHALLTGSQALDSGNNTACASAPINGVDQRGVSRPQNGVCDMGAYEYAPAVAGGAAGGLGPGGVGHTDGSTNLALWLRADHGVYADTTCQTPAANGNAVGCWQDGSGYSRSYTQATAGNRPSYLTAGQNGQPIIRLDGSNDRLTNPGSGGAVLARGDDTFSYFAAWMSRSGNSFQVVYEQNHNTVVNGRRAALILNQNASRYGFNGQSNDFMNSASYTVGQYQVSAIVLNGAASSNVLVTARGTSHTGSINMTTQNVGVDGGSAIGYKISQSIEYFRGDIPEVIVFSDNLPAVQRILIENYLSARYNVPLNVNDVYDGDTFGNDDFDLGVAGIGRFSSVAHSQAHSSGMIVRNADFLQQNGDWLLFGHNVPVNGNTGDDLPVTGDWDGAPNPQRWLRSFYIDVTDASSNGGNVDIIFDLSEGGMTAPLPAGPANNYRLLKRDNPTGTFEDITVASGATVNVVGDQIQFLGVDVSVLGSNFTVGTLDADNSPTAITLSNIAAQSSSGVNWLVVLMLALALTVSAGYLARKRHTSG